MNRVHDADGSADSLINCCYLVRFQGGLLRKLLRGVAALTQSDADPYIIQINLCQCFRPYASVFKVNVQIPNLLSWVRFLTLVLITRKSWQSTCHTRLPSISRVSEYLRVGDGRWYLYRETILSYCKAFGKRHRAPAKVRESDYLSGRVTANTA